MRQAQVYLTPEAWQATQQELTQLREAAAQQRQAAEQAERARLAALAEAGQVTEALNQLTARSDQALAEAQARTAAVQGNWLNERRSSVINQVLATRAAEFAGDPQVTATQLRQLLEGEIESIAGPDGVPVVRCRQTLRPAEAVLIERINSPSFAHFFKPTTRGGAGSGGAQPASGQPQPGSYEELAARFKQTREAQQSGAFFQNAPPVDRG